jgi:hypothetical protein
MRMYLESCLPATAGEYAWCSCFWEHWVCISREARLECNAVSWIGRVLMVKDVTSSFGVCPVSQDEICVLTHPCQLCRETEVG